MHNRPAKERNPILKNVGGVIRTMRLPFDNRPPTRQRAILSILITGYFRWKTRLKM